LGIVDGEGEETEEGEGDGDTIDDNEVDGGEEIDNKQEEDNVSSFIIFREGFSMVRWKEELMEAKVEKLVIAE